MKFEYLFDTYVAQDGTIFGDELFRFDAFGNCRVYSVSEKTEKARFRLERIDEWRPHSNAVCFGTEKFDENDEFPLLYSNVYNNYSKAEERREGCLCIYRLKRENEGFSAALVGVIRVGFVHDLSLWRSLEERADVRPYGNFVIDAEKNKMYAFVMRDKENVTRFFTFNIPKLSDGEVSDGVSYVTLGKGDILDMFDTEYMRYMQGACAKNGVVYSVEGFAPGVNPARFRVIDVEAKAVTHDVMLEDYELPKEPEFIDFHGEELFYSDATGKMYLVEF